jgi:hypothetical protein
LVLPLLGIVLYGAAGKDDAYITYWASKMLATSGEIVNYNGDRLEQSSSLLHTVLLAGLTKVTTLSVPLLGYVAGVLGGVATCVLAGAVAGALDARARVLATLLAATSAYLVYWSFGGLETALVPLALLGALWTSARYLEAGPTRGRAWAAACAILAYVAVRPEGGPVLVAVLGAALALALAAPRIGRLAPYAPAIGRPRDLALLLALVLVAIGSLVLFRELYFGAAVPQPVAAKAGLRLSEGLTYVERWLKLPHMVLFVLAAVAALPFVLRRPRPLSVLLALALAATTAFVVTAGGDWMEAGRMLVPSVVLAAVLIAVAAVRLPGAALAVVAAALVAIQLVGVVHVARRYSAGRPLGGHVAVVLSPADRAAVGAAPFYERVNRVHVRDLVFGAHLERIVGRLIADGRTIHIASGQAGMVPYYLFSRYGDHLRFFDIGSLSTDSWAGCKADLVRSALGAGVPGLAFWLANHRRCRAPLPDVFYGLHSPDRVFRAGYAPVYVQPPAPIGSGSSHLPGEATTMAEFVLVRRTLLPLLSGGSGGTAAAAGGASAP